MHHLSRFAPLAAVVLLFAYACSKPPSDEAIAAQIKARFFSDPAVKLATINVAVHQGEVTLEGAVSSTAVELQALTLAGGTEGVRHLNDKLKVSPAAANPAANIPVEASAQPVHASPTPGRQWLYPWPQEQAPQEQPGQESAVPEPNESAGETAPVMQEATYIETPAASEAPVPDPTPDSTSTTEQTSAANHFLLGSGTAFPAALYRKWSLDYRSITNIQTAYQASTSESGLLAVTQGSSDFGATDIILSTRDLDTFKARHNGHNPIAIPTVIGAVVPVYNIPGITTALNFSGPVLAAIYLGKITRWNDPAIAELNPSANLPSLPVVPLHRADPGGTTFCFTDYLSKISPEWHQRFGTAGALQWPVGLGASGNLAEATLLDQTSGSLGFVDLTYVLKHNMQFGKVQNRSGEFIKADLNTLTAAAASVKPSSTDLQVDITNAPGTGVYPISYLTWLLIPDTGKQPGKADAIRGLLKWEITIGQREAEPLNYARLPKSIVASAEKRITLIH
jgi:phosphate transport system substrate-binding protein